MRVVVADVNYGMERLVDRHTVTLEQYPTPSYWDYEASAHGNLTDREKRTFSYLSRSLLTSYADLVAVTSRCVLAEIRVIASLLSRPETCALAIFRRVASSLSAAPAPTLGSFTFRIG